MDKRPEVDQPLDVATVTRDAQLLDALGQGEPPPTDNELAGLLAAWRADLSADLPATDLVPDSALPTSPALTVRPARVTVGAPPASAGAIGLRRRIGRRARTSIAAAAAVIASAGGVAVAAGDAGPESPLWPVTQVVYADRADSRLAQLRAEDALDRARTAVGERRYADADRLLDETAEMINRVRDRQVAEQLRAELTATRGLLPGAVPEQLPSAPSLPGGVTPSRRAPSTPASPDGGTPAPNSSSSPGGLLPDLPPSLLPGLPLPLPSLLD